MFSMNERLRDLAGEISFLVERGRGATAEFDRLVATYEAARQEQVAASLLAEQRQAAMERCGIEVAELDLPILTALDFDGPTAEGTHIQYAVYQDIDCVGLYDDSAAAYEYAYELASELIEQGDLQ